MNNTLAIKLNQVQQLRILPQQLQLGRVLELSDQEVEDLINLTVNDNPALEFKNNDNEVGQTPDESGADYKSEPVDIYDFDISRKSTGTADNWLSNYSREAQESLTEHVMNQLAEFSLSDEDMTVAEYMVGCLDSNGYMTRTRQGIVDDFLMQRGSELSPERVNEVWDTLRKVDPPGIGATDLRDCLMLQLQRITKHSEAVADALTIIDMHFDEFVKGNRRKLAQATGLSDVRVEKAIAVISRLNPKPGREFVSNQDDTAAMHINPDFSVLPDIYRADTLDIKVISYFPELTVDESFRVESTNLSADDSSREKKQQRDAALFLKEKCREADNFIALIKLRQNTLLKVIKAIARRQKDFFLTGDMLKLKPMGLKDLSADTGIDTSMLSRATSGRYVLTVAGVIALKALFNGKRPDGTDDGTTANHIIALLHEMIACENPEAPYTDDDLSAMLGSKGITIARRTVAKYREMAGIPSVRQRKAEHLNRSIK